jgi:hypothetical protein
LDPGEAQHEESKQESLECDSVTFCVAGYNEKAGKEQGDPKSRKLVAGNEDESMDGDEGKVSLSSSSSVKMGSFVPATKYPLFVYGPVSGKRKLRTCQESIDSPLRHSQHFSKQFFQTILPNNILWNASDALQYNFADRHQHESECVLLSGAMILPENSSGGGVCKR